MGSASEGIGMSKHTCKVCQKSQDEVRHMIVVGKDGFGVCDECVKLLTVIMAHEDHAWRDRLIEALQALED
jgi:hypothetical protein